MQRMIDQGYKIDHVFYEKDRPNLSYGGGAIYDSALSGREPGGISRLKKVIPFLVKNGALTRRPASPLGYVELLSAPSLELLMQNGVSSNEKPDTPLAPGTFEHWNWPWTNHDSPLSRVLSQRRIFKDPTFDAESSVKARILLRYGADPNWPPGQLFKSPQTMETSCW